MSEQHIKQNVLVTESKRTNEALSSAEGALWADPSVHTFCFRRHGKYDREGKTRGQVTTDSMPTIRQAADDILAQVGPGSVVNLVASPTFMPAERQVEISIMQNGTLERVSIEQQLRARRATATSAVMGRHMLRSMGVDSYEGQSGQIMINRENPLDPDTGEAVEENRKLGDIFEYYMPGEFNTVSSFFEVLTKSEFGGMNPKFWHAYKTGQLPSELRKAFVQSGGSEAIDKVHDVVTWIDNKDMPEDGKKHVEVAVSHEEVVGSFIFQVSEFVKDSPNVDQATKDMLTAAEVSYTEGFDIHFGADGIMTFVLKGKAVKLDVDEFKEFIELRYTLNDAEKKAILAQR